MTRYASPQTIFGEMVKASISRIQVFHSDLYHDAIGMSQRREAPDSVGYTELRHPFLWLVGLHGTRLIWCDRAKAFDVKVIAEDFSAIYFFDGYTIAPIGIEDALTSLRSHQSLQMET